MSVTFIKQVSGGSTGDSCAPSVNVYKASGVSSSARSDAAFGIKAVCEQLYNSGKIDGYLVQQYDTDWDFSGYCSDNGVIRDRIEQKRKEEGYTGTGLHLCVVPCSSDYPPATGSADGGLLWTKSVDAHATEDSGDITRTAAHEFLHTAVYSGCQYVYPQIDDNEHDLGNVLINGSERQRTPFMGLAISGERGSCNKDDGSWDTNTLELSVCSKDSVKYSANHALNTHQYDYC